MKWNNKFIYPKSSRSTEDGLRKYLIDGEKLPSVTSVIDFTKSIEDKAALANWRERTGVDLANKIQKDAAKRGGKMHSLLEQYLFGKLNLSLFEKNEEFQKVNLKGTIVSEESKTKLVDFEADHEKFGSRLKEYQNYIMMQNKNEHVRNFLAAPVSSLNGVGGVTTKYLNKLGIESCGDLLFHFPRDILDKSLVKPLSEVQIGDHASLYVMVKEVKEGSSSAPLRIRCMKDYAI